MIIATEMKDPVDQEGDHLLREGMPRGFGLAHRHRKRNDHITEQWSRWARGLSEGKGQHIGGRIPLAKLPVESAHSLFSDQLKAKFRACFSHLREYGLCQLPDSALHEGHGGNPTSDNNRH